APLPTGLGPSWGYPANLNYTLNGNVLPAGTGVARVFKTQEIEGYGQDSWRIRQNLTLTYGLRWSTSTPVYEANGVQVAPTVALGDYFDKRVAGAKAGIPYKAPVTIDIAGKGNDKPRYHPHDWNNFPPALPLPPPPHPPNPL